MNNLPLSPLVYELGNSLIANLAIPLLIILARFFLIEVKDQGLVGAYNRMRFRLGMSIAAIVAGEASYRAWTWWGRYCANTESNCNWMLAAAWPMVPVFSIALEIVGMLCMIRILIPDVWGTRAWVFSGLAAAAWSLYWFTGWDELADWILSVL